MLDHGCFDSGADAVVRRLAGATNHMRSRLKPHKAPIRDLLCIIIEIVRAKIITRSAVRPAPCTWMPECLVSS